MHRFLIPLLALLLVATNAAPVQKKKKKKKQQDNIVVVDPANAGPDWHTQGEYLGKIGGDTLGAEVIARGNGKFEVNFLPGGLRGKGGDYAKRISATAKRDGNKITVTGKGNKWSAKVTGGVMTGNNGAGQQFMLKKTVRTSDTLGLQPPKGATILYANGKDKDKWTNSEVTAGHLVGHDCTSKMKFKDHKIHLEFRLSFMPGRTGQARSNSGVYVQSRYEIQVLDSFGLRGVDNECGGLYRTATPKVNMCLPPLQWQTYDIELKAARFDESGKRISKAVLTVRHNGVVIHDRIELKGTTAGNRLKESSEPGPLFLQGHGGQVQYRNIWVAE